jgi:putative tryptophan/tyrosine transport system substrate-binding protein
MPSPSRGLGYRATMAIRRHYRIPGHPVRACLSRAPSAVQVAYVGDHAAPQQRPAATKVAGQLLTVEVQPLRARGPNEFDSAFAVMSASRVDALVVLADALFNVHRTRLAVLAAKNRLPVMFGIRENVEVGGLMSYGPSIRDLFRRSATFVDKIFKGVKPGDMPVEQPTKFELIINMGTAKALGLTIPQSILLRADEVIE